MKPAEVAKIVAVLKAAYPRQEIGTDTIRIYSDMLADLEFANALAVVKKSLATSEWFPSIARLRILYAEAALRLPEVDEAWTEVRTGIRAFGRERLPEWSCNAVASTVEAIGWRTLCESTSLASERARFCEFYGKARERLVVAANLSSLTAKPAELEPVAKVIALVSDGKRAP